MQLEIVEGGLGQVGEFDLDLARLGVGVDRADQLGVDPEAGASSKRRY